MTVAALLRGINIGAHHRIKMDALRAHYEGQGLRNVRSFIQSGNLVFDTTLRDMERLRVKLETAFAAEFGFTPATLLRTGAELRAILDANPFAGRPGLDPAKLVVFFLPTPIDEASRTKLDAFRSLPEEIRPAQREIYIYFPDGMGRAQLTSTMLDRVVGKASTARNWNTVNALAEMAGA
jgi:uncharacterized protein (DUF1697 family)